MQVSFLQDSIMSGMDTDAEMPVNRLNFSGISSGISSEYPLSTNSFISSSVSSSSKKRKRIDDSLPKSKKQRISSNNESPNAVSLNSIDENSPMSIESGKDTKTVNKNDNKTPYKPQRILRRSPRLYNKLHKPQTDINIELLSSLSLSPVLNKWNATATPIKSSLKKDKTKKIIKSKSAKVNWGNIECRNYEQRCGVLSSAVPTESGPSLHLGKLLSETTTNIDEYESGKQRNYECNELPKKERIQRVKQFSIQDIDKKKLKQDMNEIKLLQKSREDIGCQCISIYKMKKKQIIERIIYLKDMDKNEMKKLKKHNKPVLFNILIKIQFDKYGRYDVCCVDEDCYCFKEGIECQIDNECCGCGGDIVYNNYLNEIKEKNKKKNKKNSLCCGNPNGNTLNVSVLDYVDNTNCDSLYQHDVAKKVESSFLPFKSPVVKKRISEWNEHYDVDDKENEETLNEILKFDP